MAERRVGEDPEETGSELRLRRFASAAAATREVAREIAELVRAGLADRRGPVLGLATGRSPVGVYRELARLHREEGLSFRYAVTFNLDELEDPSDPTGTFGRFMRAELFERVDLAPANTHLLRGDLSPRAARAHCAAYERAIVASGGIDLQLLGIGRNGHIAFNEPGSSRDSRTRRVELAASTRDALRRGPDAGEPPRFALTLGLATILEARRIRLLALDASKAAALQRVLHGPVAADCPASQLREHPDVEILATAF